MNGTVTVRWTLVAGANACGRDTIFSVYLSEDQNSMQIVTTTASTSYLFLFTILQPKCRFTTYLDDGVYFVAVQANNGLQGTVSDVISFVVCALHYPRLQ